MDIVRGPVKEMMREIGVPYANSFLEHTVRTYQLSEKDICCVKKRKSVYSITLNRYLQLQGVHMGKLKSIIFVVGIMLLILAAVMGCLSIRYLSAILPADSYEDKGVYTFSPYQVLPV